MSWIIFILPFSMADYLFGNFSEVNWTVSLILRPEEMGPEGQELVGTSGNRGAASSWPHTSEKSSQQEKEPQPHLLHLLWRGDQHQRIRLPPVCLNCCLNLLFGFLGFFSWERSHYLLPTTWWAGRFFFSFPWHSEFLFRCRVGAGR